MELPEFDWKTIPKSQITLAENTLLSMCKAKMPCELLRAPRDTIRPSLQAATSPLVKLSWWTLVNKGWASSQDTTLFFFKGREREEFLCFFNFLFYIGVQLIYNVVLVSGIQQSDLVIHTSILFQILFQYRLLKSTEYSSLCYTVGPCWLSILYVVVCLC